MDPQDDTDPYITKIGGIPSWLDQDVPAPSKYGICKACGKDMYLLLQAYVPLEKSPYDRVVYVWACNQRLCMRKEGSFRVVRALKLNPEYARKLEKKPKLSVAPVTTSASTSGAPLLAANPFATSGATNMGSTLFGGSSVAFNNPFASTTNNINPFAPPPGFGTGTPITTPPCTTIKSFASAASAAITPTEESSSESEEEHDTVEEPSTWPENPVGFDPYYLYITEEVLEDSHPLDDDISQRYSHLMALEEAANRNDASEEDGEDSISAATWSGEAYEKAALPKGVDKAFKKFTKRVQSWPDQCVRYDFPGVPLLFSYSDRTAHLLLPPNVASHSKHTTPSAHRIPRCPSCKGPRGFEFQLMPNLLSLLDVTSKKYLSEEEKKSLKERKGAQVFDIGMEWGTVLVYSCVEDCFGKKATAAAMQGEDDDNSNNNSQKVKYFEEVALVQFED
ncbi:programmed cell death protein 2 [Lobosporangium transversale]|uniref:Programmed cell death protein 2 n=1 Tax=Lobosporangium transversale TaxID=64571 RepID=A0A1Y2H4W5_9FUNG|nr:programmed cell death protein 2 [Lobosporangium transversale]ORZ29044.1 programmed cell death protein 2 [Lobosporangium transversale]|eukprot:XP_021886717.1 programmed cell death protein 2 [Lobosporangium transversale]